MHARTYMHTYTHTHTAGASATGSDSNVSMCGSEHQEMHDPRVDGQVFAEFGYEDRMCSHSELHGGVMEVFSVDDDPVNQMVIEGLLVPQVCVICVRVCFCACVCVCARARPPVRVYTYTLHVYVCMYICIYICVCVCIYIYIYKLADRGFQHTCMHVYICARTQSTGICRDSRHGW
jgi:hypothetical protein